MLKNTLKKTGLLIAVISLAACSAGERIANIGKAPDLTPIKDIKAPPAQRSISLPMPDTRTTRPNANSLWRTGAKAFFKDQRASNIGDILTVNIAIADNAQIGNTTTRARTTEEGAGLTNFLGFEQQIRNVLHGSAPTTGTDNRPTVNPATLINADSSTSYNGTGSVNRSEAINLTLAAIVTDVLPNGNLVIQARQEVRVNFEKREMLLAGIIRPEDISSSNQISHTQIAEARISYGGKGQITDVQQPRYGQQLYDIVFPF
ncbi:flagellar basal body L-ring protein FlgH [Kordiimonas sp. SCSIO 12603]|uniref:flagellar basal body L-ring protein FlgH n=1 Tax=Kordiimonas sp. SCSIO 12603 TaxID=2829596 RepID=UPI00210569D4|nr:flagellar basal body L-ring protein FlgH [Kordiimonas sp. SCSIO 12603]UTW57611.1 flagellar basal body L-ring protein FlgH [Kordiimonas sp. SCSIO 12603]